MEINDKQQQWIIFLGFSSLSIAVSYLSSHFPSLMMLIILMILGLGILLKFPDRALDVAIFGSFFDEVDFNAGFAKLGLGDLGLFVLLAVWLSRSLTGHMPSRAKGYRFPKGLTLLFFYLCFMAMSMYLGQAYSSVYGRYFRLITYVLGVFAIADSIRDERTFKRIFYIGIVAAVINSFVAFWMEGASGQRLEGLAYQSNILAFTIGMGLIFMFAFITYQHSSYLLRSTLIVLLIPSVIAFFFTGSRGATISLAIAILWNYKTHWRGLILSLIALVLSLLLIAQIDGERFNVLSRRFSFEGNDGSVAERQKILAYRLSMLTRYPFFGQGFDQLDESRQFDKNTDIAHKGAHNSYVGMASSSGLLPTLTLFTYVLLQAIQLWKNRKQIKALGEDKTLDFLINTLQMLFIFHSMSLLFRGTCRMLDWTPLALYSAINLLALERLTLGWQNKNQALPPTEINQPPTNIEKVPSTVLVRY
jgi:O-antigen ligase